MSRATIALIVAVAALAATGCTDEAEQTPPPSATTPDEAAETSSDESGATLTAEPGQGAPELNTDTPITEGMERSWPEEIDTVSSGDREFTLFGVHRLDDERAVVTGRIAGAATSTAAAQWFEPGYLHTMNGYEFSRVAVLDSDDVRHLPVRDKDDRCLCSLSTAVYAELGAQGQAPAWAVVDLPQGQSVVDVEIPDVGTIEDVEVTDLPQTTTVPFGWNETLSIATVSREAGVVTATTTIANPGDFRPTYTLAQHQFGFPDLEGTGCFQGLAVYGGPAPTGRMAQDDACYRGSMPEAGQQITLEVKVADPGADTLVVLPDAGLPLVVSATGTPAEGAEQSLRTYHARTEEAGATVESGEVLTVNLDTEVLFEFDEATLTGDAGAAIEVAAEALKEQDKTAIVVAGHTDGQGSDARNEELSEQRATAVATALEEELGSGWDVSVEWHGSAEPVAEEKGTPEQIEAAQARNRRVEITVP